MACPASQKFSPRMTAAQLQDSTFTQPRLANEPMRRRSLVKWISGITANGNCMLMITWLSSSRSRVELVAHEPDGQGRRNNGDASG